MGFWSALSALAPLPASLNDARALNLAQHQEQEQFGQESALRDAQITAQKLAAQAEQERLKEPAFLPGSKPYYDSSQGSMVQAALVDGQLKAVPVPGLAPAAELQQAAKGIKDAFSAMGLKTPSGVLEDLAYRIFGGTGAFNPMAGVGTPKPVQLAGPDGKPYDAVFYGGNYYDPGTGQVIAHPVPFVKSPVPQPKPGTLNGKPAWGVNIPDRGWVDPETDQPIPDFKPAPTYAQVLPQTLSRSTVTVTGSDGLTHRMQYNPSTQRYDIDAGIDLGGQAAHQIFQSLSVKQQAQQVLLDIKANRDLMGNLDSYVKQGLANTPFADPRANKLIAELSSLANMQPALHAFRSQSAAQAFDKMLGGLARNPDATVATIQGLMYTPEAFINIARGGASKANAINQTESKKRVSLKAAMALPVNKGKTAQQVAADIRAHGYEVLNDAR